MVQVSVLGTICTRFQVTQGNVTIACDGLSALNRGIVERAYPPDPFSSHSDAVASDRQVISSLPLNVSAVHVKGHQRERGGFAGSRLIGPLDELATMNDEVDTRANIFRLTLPTQDYPIDDIFPSQSWTLLLADRPVLTDSRNILQEAMSSPALLDYWKNKRNKFGSLTPTSIDWQATANCMRALPSSRRLHSTKIASTFVAVRRRQNLRRQAPNDHCPRCYTEQLPTQTESVAHLFSCPSQGSRQLWDTSLQALEEWMLCHNTDPILRQMILSGLKSWQQLPHDPIPLNHEYQQLSHDQNEVGWQSLLEGRMVKGWATRQEAFFRTHQYAHTSTGLRWLSSLLRQLMDIAWDQWEHRNGILHHATLGARHQEILLLVQREFSVGHGHYGPLVRLFSPGVARISARTAAQLEQWINIVHAHRSQPQPNRTLLAQQALMRSQFSRT